MSGSFNFGQLVLRPLFAFCLFTSLEDIALDFDFGQFFSFFFELFLKALQKNFELGDQIQVGVAAFRLVSVLLFVFNDLLSFFSESFSGSFNGSFEVDSLLE